MFSRYAERRDQHGEAPEEEDSPGNGEKATHQDEPAKTNRDSLTDVAYQLRPFLLPVLVEEDDDSPEHEEGHPGELAHLERPRDVGNVVWGEK